MIQEQEPQDTMRQRERNSLPNMQQFAGEHLFQEGLNAIHIPKHRTKFQLHLLFYYITLLQKKLPNMPINYLFDTVLLPNNQNIVILNDRQFQGGLTFCHTAKKYELILLASSEQRKGYGTNLIHHLIQSAQNRGVNIIFTQADNRAIEFYHKVGFSQSPRKEKVESLLTNATLMELRIDPRIDYFKLKKVIRLQKQRLINKRSREGQLKCMKSNQYMVRGQRFRMNPQRLLLHDFWQEYKELTSSKHHKIYQMLVKPLNALIDIAVPQLVETPFTAQQLSLFTYDPPIDLQAIKKNISIRKYIEKEEFYIDLEEVLDNCRHLYIGNKKIQNNIEILAKQIQRTKKDI